MLARFTLLITLLALPLSSLQAAAVTGLYEAEVPVADQSQESYQDGLTRALKAVLVKLTGERDVQGRQVTAYLLDNPQLYVQQYKYRNKAKQKADQLTLEKELFLWVQFNEPALKNVFRDYQVPLWGNVRPNTLVWVLVEENGERRYVTLEEEEAYTSVFENSAQKRGIPLSYPLLDEEDRVMVEKADIWGGFSEPVKRASQRYSPNAILMGSVYQISARMWEARWMAIVDDRPISWTQSAENPELVLAEGIDKLADILADRYVQATGGLQDTRIEVTVDNVYKYDEHARVLKYFRSLSNVSDVNIKSLKTGSVTFSINTAGSDEQGLRQTIQLGNTLEPVAGNTNHYRLIR